MAELNVGSNKTADNRNVVSTTYTDPDTQEETLVTDVRDKTLRDRIIAVEEKLDTIINDGVKQSGSIVAQIKSYTHTAGTPNRYYGDTVTPSTPDKSEQLDVSEYNQRSIVIINDTDAEVFAIRLFSNQIFDGVDKQVYAPSFPSIPAGSQLIINADTTDAEGINDSYVDSYSIRVNNENGTTGNVYIGFFGGRK